MRRRARTCEAPRAELDMMVLAFTCREDSAFASMGKNSKEMKWQVAAMGTQPLEIKLNVEKSPGYDAEVGITCDGKKLWPLSAGEREKLKDDFEQKWPFRGEVKNLGKEDFFEVRPKAMGDNWFLAQKLVQRKDGLFEASVWLPDGDGGTRQVMLPAVEKKDIRQEKTKLPLDIPERCVVLSVPKADPVYRTTLSLADDVDSDLITHYFARPTPPPASGVGSLPGPNEIRMEVTQDRKTVTTDVSHTTLAQHMSSQPFSLGCKSESKVKTVWTLMFGPFAKHTIAIEKRGIGAASTAIGAASTVGGLLSQVAGGAETVLLQQSPVVALVVDGKDLVEAISKDIDEDDEGESGSAWACRFRFLGERSVKFKVFETNNVGMTLDTTDLVEGLRKDQINISKVCTVKVGDLTDLGTASLEIDGVNFNELQRHGDLPVDKAQLSCDPQVLEMQYDLATPTKIRDATALAAVQEKLQALGEALGGRMKDDWEKAQPGLLSLGQKLQDTWKSASGGYAAAAPAASADSGSKAKAAASAQLGDDSLSL